MAVEAKPCDLLVTADLPSPAPLLDGYCVLVHSASGHDVDTVIVDGRVVLSGGRLTLADGDAFVARAQRVAARCGRGRVAIRSVGSR